MSVERVSLRPLAEADIEPLRTLAREIWESHYLPIIGAAQIQYMLDQRYRPEVLREELARTDLWWDLLLIEDVPRGYASYFIDGDGRSLKLDKLYVHPTCQRGGYGKQMLERVLAQARSLGCKRVTLAVNKRNPKAIAAYEKWGFRIEQAVTKDIGGGFMMDDYVMVHDIGLAYSTQDSNRHRMRLKFTKMHGLGNDFVVVDATREPFTLTAPVLRRLADRRFGIGCDQILVVERPRTAGADFHYRIFNADGGEVQSCGNGARCFARFVRDKGLTDKPEIRVETAAGIIVPRVHPDGLVTVDMGVPEFEPERIPFLADRRAPTYALEVGSQRRTIRAVSMGNPHAVQVVEHVDAAPVDAEGPLIEAHTRFPERVNAGFMQVVDRHAIRLRVYERGAGETLACGTGACAAVVTGISGGLLESPVRVSTRGGDLDITWAGEGAPVLMTGPAETVFEGEIEL